ncbi:membrane protein [Mycolicibacterium madagascariense]|uniref:Membrane protein n=1 Tax=Mycolicibacterium madagascariense TaxID=212765 RepID=A0A7I7XD40_9MYCO|nr:mechanosensitive ion channel family protein [Mycolicibacterium madagascariense]MCV7011734.1 mechanosensitive ion channel [Mycolicibacterium madagascariense]BBZ27372.1 membrane protein [Mycolicibacterium madagascariense]
MTSTWDASWFAWAIGVAIGLPIALVILTEVRAALQRRGSSLALPVSVVRNYLLPLGALLLVLLKATEISAHATPIRIVSTAFGFVLLLLALSGLNATLFQGAPEGSWRKRIPSIFLDVARFVVIAIGLALILSYIWGANVGGMFTALGVTSIVLGLALQNSFGQIISGLFLLFEQPFRIGDWVDTPSAQGRVVEVNWRATHIDTGSGLQIIPNSVLALASFNNLSRPAGQHVMPVVVQFGFDDPPNDVCEVLEKVANSLPQLAPGATSACVAVGEGKYRTSIPLTSAGERSPAKATFLHWIWYASRRAGLHLDDADDHFTTPTRMTTALRLFTPTLHLDDDDRRVLSAVARLARYGADETIQAPGHIPTRVTFIVTGHIRVATLDAHGAMVDVRTLREGDLIGASALTDEPSTTAAYAVGEVTVLQIQRRDMKELILRKPLLAHEFGRVIEEFDDDVRRALGMAQ